MINKIHHDDCMSFMKTMKDKSVNLTLTDIPYGECNQKSGGLRLLDRTFANECDFNITEFVNEVVRVTSGSLYIFCGIEQASPIFSEVSKNMSARLCHWVKSNPSPMNGQHMWLSATECCVFGKNSGAIFNEHCKPNVWIFPSGSSKMHPTEKPVELFVRLILASSKAQDIVFDPCIGSGTTAIASINTGRKFIGVEKNLKAFTLCSNRLAAAKSGHEGDIFSKTWSN